MKKAITIIYYIIIGFLLARVIISWVPALHDNIIGKIVFMATEPVLAPMRKIIPSVGGLDLTVLILWFGLSYLYRWLMVKLA